MNLNYALVECGYGDRERRTGDLQGRKMEEGIENCIPKKYRENIIWVDTENNLYAFKLRDKKMKKDECINELEKRKSELSNGDFTRNIICYAIQHIKNLSGSG